MNTLLPTRPPTVDVPAWQAAPVRRLTLPDRIALRIGLALVLWARRPLPEEPEVLRRRAQVIADADGRRIAADRTLRLLVPLR
jgi:hypothetical protein